MKTLEELLASYDIQEDLFYEVDYKFEQVERDEEDQHRWYTYWRHVYKIMDGEAPRYFAVKIPEMKGEEGSWYDIDFEVTLNSFYEVYPEDVVKTVYKEKK